MKILISFLMIVGMNLSMAEEAQTPSAAQPCSTELGKTPTGPTSETAASGTQVTSEGAEKDCSVEGTPGC